MLRLESFINELMTSNCYLLWDDESHRCIVIDPASEKSTREIDFIHNMALKLDYILLTHEHTDHNWGVNSLLDSYPDAKVICHEIAKVNMDMESKSYFRLYYDNPTYSYRIQRVDIAIDQKEFEIDWNGYTIRFIHVPGHSMGSECILINGWLFTGDTILQSKPYVNRRNGSKELLKDSIRKILATFDGEQMICPGHGGQFKLKNYSIPYGISDKENI